MVEHGRMGRDGGDALGTGGQQPATGADLWGRGKLMSGMNGASAAINVNGTSPVNSLSVI